MPVVLVPVGVALGVLLLFLLRVLLLLLVIPAAEAASKYVPVIGKYFLQAAAKVADFLDDVWRKHVAANAGALVGWFHGVADVLRELPRDVAAFATRVEAAYGVLVGDTIPTMIGDAVRPIVGDVAALTARIGGVDSRLESLRGGVNARLEQLTVQLWERAIGAVADIRNVDLPALRGEVWRGIDDLGSSIAGRITAELAGVRADIGAIRSDIAGRINSEQLRQAGELAGLAALVGAVVMPAVRAVERCSSKLNRMCTTDPLDFDDLMLGLILAAYIPSIGELIEETQWLAGETIPVVVDMAE